MYAGDPAVLVPRLAAAAGVRSVVWAAGLEPDELADDDAVARRLRDAGREPVIVPSGNLLNDPAGPLTREGRPYTVFTPYWRTCLSRLGAGRIGRGGGAGCRDPGARSPRLPLRPPSRGRSRRRRCAHETGHAWAAGFGDVWRPGETGAHDALTRFLDGGLATYATGRDLVAEAGTSRLSPHLHWGEVTAWQVWNAVAGRLAEEGLEVEAAVAPAARDDEHAPGLSRSAGAFLRQLGWREFGHHLLRHFPTTPERPLHETFERFPWREDPAALEAWRRGLTGYPLVDAGMRQLWATGWLHNRARLVAASFLVKHLLLPWRLGEEWFWDTLLDADLADNALGWQWVAGSGADAAPYFRIFNPVTQGRRYDPGGAYVRTLGAGAGRAGRRRRARPVAGHAGRPDGRRSGPSAVPTRLRWWITARPAPARSPPTTSCAARRAELSPARRSPERAARRARPARTSVACRSARGRPTRG